MTIASNTASAAPVPISAPGQPRTVPTASTTVRASTNSTSDAKNAAVMVGHACPQSMIIGVSEQR